MAILREEKITGIFYECKETTEKNNVRSLSELIGETFHFPKPSFDDMEELLKYLFEKAEESRLVLVLDKYPYLRAAVTGLDSILQNLIDRYRKKSKVKFIICGSHIGIMKSLLDSQNPLYGRIDRTINLQPMDYYESALFYESFIPEDRVRLYSVFGGIPHYNRLIDPDLCKGTRYCYFIIIQSVLGGAITPEEVLKRIPADADTGYIKTEENKAYWVRGAESGSVDLWQ